MNKKSYLARHNSDYVINRQIIREQDGVLARPGPKYIIDSVSPDNVHLSFKSLMEEWWFPMLDSLIC